MPLDPPLRNEQGEVQPHDHAGIASGDRVIRRISEHFIVTGGMGERRLSSMAFRPSSRAGDGMSVDLERLIIDAGVEPRDFVTTPKWTGSVWWQAEQIRALTMMVGFDPTDDNPFHGQVWGAFTTAQRRSLQASAAWFVALPGIAISSE